jgi:hypothetical protein
MNQPDAGPSRSPEEAEISDGESHVSAEERTSEDAREKTLVAAILSALDTIATIIRAALTVRPDDEREGVSAGGPPETPEDVTRDVMADLGQPPPPPPDTVESATESRPPVDLLAFLHQMKEKSAAARQRIELQRVANDRRESILFVLLLVAAVITVAIAAAGILLILTGHSAVGVVSTAVAILPGVGTLSLRRLWHSVRGRRDELRRYEKEHDALVEAIEFTLGLPDSAERDRKTADLADRLQARAFASH